MHFFVAFSSFIALFRGGNALRYHCPKHLAEHAYGGLDGSGVQEVSHI